MLSGLGLGTYRAGTSIAHRLDARSKIFAVLGVTVAAFGALHVYYYAVIAVALILASLVGRVDMVALVRSMAVVLLLLGLSSFIAGQFIFGWEFAIRTFCQFSVLIYATQVLTLTTAPLAIATGLQRLCGWMRRLRVPVDELAMLITLALTFLPLIREQIRTVIDAQLARGVDLRSGPLETRLRGVLSFFNPIVSANLRRADELATAMEARGYRVGALRTHLREQRFRQADYLLLLLTLLLCVGGFVR